MIFLNQKFFFKSIALLCLCSLNFVFSQNCNSFITGNLVDLHDNTPIIGATIRIQGLEKSAISNSEGAFILEGLCKGDYTLEAIHPFCEIQTQEVSLNNKVVGLKLFLEHHIEALQEVILSENSQKSLSKTGLELSLSADEMERYSSKSLAAGLEQLSGVSVLNTGNAISKPIIQGMFGSRVGIVYNEMRLENQQWGADHAPNVDLNAFEGLRLIKGAAVLKYAGDTPGGIVVLESKQLKITDTLYGKTLLTGASNGRGGSLVSSWVRSFNSGTYLKLQGTIKKFGDFSAPNYNLSNTGINENNFSFHLGQNKILQKWLFSYSYFKNEIGILRASHIGNVEDLLSALKSSRPIIINSFGYEINSPKQESEHHTLSLTYSKRFLTNNKWSIRYNFQNNNRKEFDIRKNENKGKAAIDLLLKTHSLNTDFEWKPSSSTSQLSGLFFQLQDNFSDPETDVKRLVPDYLKYKYGGYATLDFSPSNNFNFELGIRLEHQDIEVQKFYNDALWKDENYQDDFGQYIIREVSSQKLIKRNLKFNNISLNTGLKTTVFPKTTVSVNYYLSQRAPDISELFSEGLHHSLATLEYGNPYLDKETIHKFTFNFEKTSGKFKFSLSPYFLNANNYIIIEPSGVKLTARGAFPLWKYKAVAAQMKGIDFDFSYKISNHLTLNNATSYVEAKEQTNDRPIINIPPLNSRSQLDITFPKWKYYRLSIISRLVFRQNDYPDNNFEASIIKMGQFYDEWVDISTPPEGYHDLGVEMALDRFAFKSNKMSISLVFENLLNTSYRNYLNRLRFYGDELGRNIQLQIKFYH